jgi:hypothetical protein
MMNERIKELAVQARNYALDEKRIYERIHNTEQCMEEYREVYNKKFAELIVNQCADIAQQHNKSPVAAPLAIGYVIREHFGVQE